MLAIVFDQDEYSHIVVIAETPCVPSLVDGITVVA